MGNACDSTWPTHPVPAVHHISGTAWKHPLGPKGLNLIQAIIFKNLRILCRNSWLQYLSVIFLKCLSTCSVMLFSLTRARSASNQAFQVCDSFYRWNLMGCYWHCCYHLSVNNPPTPNARPEFWESEMSFDWWKTYYWQCAEQNQSTQKYWPAKTMAM